MRLWIIRMAVCGALVAAVAAASTEQEQHLRLSIRCLVERHDDSPQVEAIASMVRSTMCKHLASSIADCESISAVAAPPTANLRFSPCADDRMCDVVHVTAQVQGQHALSDLKRQLNNVIGPLSTDTPTGNGQVSIQSASIIETQSSPANSPTAQPTLSSQYQSDNASFFTPDVESKFVVAVGLVSACFAVFLFISIRSWMYDRDRWAQRRRFYHNNSSIGPDGVA